MAITLASVGLSDAEVTDGIGRGDVESAARLWVRFWPVALDAARRYVDPAEVPGLAAEALIGTVAAIAIGRGPREDVASFVREAVRELGEDDDAPARPEAAPSGRHEVFTSALMTRAFAGLSGGAQQALWSSIDDATYDEATIEALTQLQRAYLAMATGRATSVACRKALPAIAVAVEATSAPLPGETWLHLSTCAWCTEAFHEIAFTNVALGALLDRSLVTPVVAAPVVEEEPVVAPPLFVDEVIDGPAPAPVLSGPLFEETEYVEPVIEDSIVLAPAEAAVIDAEEDEEDEEDEDAYAHRGAAAPLGLLRGRRARLTAVATAAVAAVATVVVIVVAAQGDPGETPVAAGTTPSATPTDPATALPGSLLSPNGEVSDLPTTIVAPPEASPTDGETATADEPTPTPSATATSAQPTPTPTSNPEPTNPPTSQAPEPTPTPTATPTRSCNGLQHLLGLC